MNIEYSHLLIIKIYVKSQHSLNLKNVYQTCLSYFYYTTLRYKLDPNYIISCFEYLKLVHIFLELNGMRACFSLHVITGEISCLMFHVCIVVILLERSFWVHSLVSHCPSYRTGVLGSVRTLSDSMWRFRAFNFRFMIQEHEFLTFVRGVFPQFYRGWRMGGRRPNLRST